MYRTFLLFLTFFVTSCNFTPPYYRITEPFPKSFRIESDESSTACNLEFWKELGDPILNALILEALDNNKDLKIAIARVYEFYAIYGEVRSSILPEIDGSGSYIRQEISNAAEIVPFPPNISRTFNLYTVGANLIYELDVWGRIRSLTDAALSKYFEEIANRRTVVLTLITSLANAYITLRQYDKQLQISLDTLKSREDSYKLAVLRFEGGLTSEMEVEQAQSEVEDALTRVKQLEILIPQQENLISVLIGHPSNAIKRGLSLDELTLPLTVPTGLPSDLLEQRPDIISAEEEVIAANALIGAARAAFFPTISLTGSYGNSSIKLHDLFAAAARQWDYAVSLTVPLFNYGRTSYHVDAAEMRKLEALYAYQQTVLKALQEVNDALIAHEKTKELVEVQKRRVEVFKRYLNLANLQYDNGQTDYLNVLDAERNLFEAELGLAETQGNSFLTFVNLYKALGGGWVVAADRESIDCP